jgi:hypothetical protein
VAVARNKAGHPLCGHEYPTDAREVCTRWWCSYRLEISFYLLCAVLITLAWWLHAPTGRLGWERPRQASHSFCQTDGQCWNDLGQNWRQEPGSLPLLQPER